MRVDAYRTWNEGHQGSSGPYSGRNTNRSEDEEKDRKTTEQGLSSPLVLSDIAHGNETWTEQTL